MMTQISISSSTGERLREKSKMTTWVDADKRLKVGMIVVLKGDDREWKIEKIFENDQPFCVIDNHGWDNNDYSQHDGTAMKDRLK